ncbi:hypothetical protein [Luteolibacter marinus]|uniref:hypothetical protein n=1 Tax=Luteolibacter marinus TaxID=2776705 RepID=UPI001865C192|nr:hypothetical protein [Luteolibacter marinus]
MTRRGLTLLAAAWLAAGLGSCSLPADGGAGSGDLGRRFTATVPGTWYTEMREGRLIGTSEKTFRADGSAEGFIQAKQRSGGFSFVMPTITFRSKWRVEGDIYLSYDVKGSQPGIFEPGKVFRDRILSVSQDRIVCKEVESGEVYTMVRKR